MSCRSILAAALAVAVAAPAALPAVAQSSQPAPPAAPAPPPQTEAAPLPVYRPPLRGAPGGRVGGASRGTALPAASLPIISLLAPADHTGLTANPQPTLYFRVSRPAAWPIRLTIRAPMQPAPVVEATVPSPTAAGLYPLPLARYGARLLPGIIYTWSVSVVIDPHAWSHNIVASATIMFDPSHAVPSAAGEPPARRAGNLAAAGLWYDAVAAAAEEAGRGRNAGLDALMRQVGLNLAAPAAAGLSQPAAGR